MEHPITPPPELVSRLIADAIGPNYVATRAAQWGWDQRGTINEAQLQERADQELEACLAHLFRRGFSDADILGLRAARRPKPPSLKEQALAALEQVEADFNTGSFGDTIRRALKALPNG
jgi:hypothetical protein